MTSSKSIDEALSVLWSKSPNTESAPARLAENLARFRYSLEHSKSALIEQIARESNHSRAVVRLAIDDALGDLREALLTREQARLIARVPKAADLVFVNLAGNVFSACVRPIVIASLLGTRVLLRASSRAQAFPKAFADALEFPVEVVEFEKSDERAYAKAGREADVVELFGSDETLDSILANTGKMNARVIRRGTGIGVVDWNMEGPPDRELDALAQDVIAFDQRGCLSPRVVVAPESVDLTKAAQQLARAIDSLNTRFPRAPFDEHTKAESSAWLATGDALGVVVRGESCAMVIDDDDALGLGPTGRHLLFRRTLDPRFRKWSKVVGAFSAPGSFARHRQLGNETTRFCQVGQMQRPNLFESADGIAAGAAYDVA